MKNTSKTTRQMAVALFIAVSLLLSNSSYSQKKEKVSGYIDHIVVTVTGAEFDSLVEILKTSVPKSLMSGTNNTKVFLLPAKTFPYVEIWNSAKSIYTGSQIALGSAEQNAIPKIKKHYGHDGKAYGDFLTVGSEFSSGHPYGGNFFVSYGSMDITNPNDSIEVAQLKEIRTLTPITKTTIKDDYAFFDLKMAEKQDSFSTTDKNGTIIHTKWVESNPEAVLGGGIGHVSLTFELADAISTEKIETEIGDNMKIIFDRKRLTLILLKSQFEKWNN